MQSKVFAFRDWQQFPNLFYNLQWFVNNQIAAYHIVNFSHVLLINNNALLFNNFDWKNSSRK